MSATVVVCVCVSMRVTVCLSVFCHAAQREMAELAELKKLVQENTSLVREVSALKRSKLALEEEREKRSQQIVQLLNQLEEASGVHQVDVLVPMFH